MLDNQLKENMFQAFYLGRPQSRNGFIPVCIFWIKIRLAVVPVLLVQEQMRKQLRQD